MLLKNNLTEVKDRYQLWTKIQLIICILFISVTAAVFITSTPIYSNKARLAGVLTMMSALKERVSTDYLETGVWPLESVLLDGSDGDFSIIERVIFDGAGTINVTFTDKYSAFSDKTLSFSAAEVTQSNISSIIWVCGYAKPPEMFEVIGHNKTDISSLILPNSCK